MDNTGFTNYFSHVSIDLQSYRSALRPTINCANSFQTESLEKKVDDYSVCSFDVDTTVLNRVELQLNNVDDKKTQAWTLVG